MIVPSTKHWTLMSLLLSGIGVGLPVYLEEYTAVECYGVFSGSGKNLGQTVWL